MSLLHFSRRAVVMIAGLSLFAGCEGQNAVAPTAMSPQRVTAFGHAGKSWMLPGASSGDLIYAVGGCGGTCVLSYPNGKFVGQVATGGTAICSDTRGNVFISNDYAVTEYAHGGTTPIATLSLPGGLGAGCAVDPETNNLAVAFAGSGVDIAIFPGEQGPPVLYASHIGSLYCSYDEDGNLFVDGYDGNQVALAEMPSGSDEFTKLSLNSLSGTPGQMQWDGQHITLEDRSAKSTAIEQLSISGSAATVVGATRLKNIGHRATASWMADGQVIVPYVLRNGTGANAIGIWNYPKGGKAQRKIKHFGSYREHTLDFQGVTVSTAP